MTNLQKVIAYLVDKREFFYQMRILGIMLGIMLGGYLVAIITKNVYDILLTRPFGSGYNHIQWIPLIFIIFIFLLKEWDAVVGGVISGLIAMVIHIMGEGFLNYWPWLIFYLSFGVVFSWSMECIGKHRGLMGSILRPRVPG